MGNDDKPRLVAYKRLSLPHESEPYLYVRSSIPLASVGAKANAAMMRNLTLLVLLVGAAIFIVYFIGKRAIVDPIMQLQAASRQLGAGAGIVKVSHKVKGGEIGALARAFDGMAEAVVQREAARDAAQAALRESEQRWATTLASIGDAVIATDLESRITFMNAVAEELTGWTLIEASMKPVKAAFNIVNQNTREEVENPVAKVLREGMIVGLANHTILIRKDLAEVPIDDSGAPIRDKDGKTVGVVLVFRDITDRKQAEETLRQQAQLLDLSYDAIFTWDLNGTIGFWNQGAEKLYGYSRDEAVGRISHELLRTGRPGGVDGLKALLERDGMWIGELSHVTKDGRTLAVESHHQLIRGDSGRRIVLETTRDVTERNRVEAEMEEKSRQLETANKELESFSYSVSHDLRAPLRAIDGYSRMILRRKADEFDAETRRQFDVIRDNVSNMGKLIDDLLAFSRLGRQDVAKADMDMGELIGEVWQELVAIHPDREMTLKAGQTPTACGDRPLIRQVYGNLLGNAVKFTQGRNPAVIEVGSCVQDNETVYYVRDNGIGFDMKFYDKLFGVFQRLHSDQEYEGTGIGLALVQRIVNRHGGRIWAEGKVDKGATFYFTLPTRRE